MQCNAQRVTHRYMYTKLFTQILDSSIWLAPDRHRIVWITLIAAMDRNGVAKFAHVRNLAARARVSVKATQEAIDAFESPDPLGLEQEYEGRRIERCDGGWFILNAEKYRNMVSSATVAEQTRERVQRYRARKKAVTPSNGTVTGNAIRSDQINLNHQNQRAIKIASSEKPKESAREKAESTDALSRIRARIGKGEVLKELP